jgi:hypothetical protein
VGQTERVRSRAARALGVGMVLASVLGLGSAAIGGMEPLLQFGAPLVLFGLLGWAAFWQPYVEVSDGGVTLANTLRTVGVPWPAIEEVNGRYGLTLRTAYGTSTAWAAQSPSGRQRAGEKQSGVAQLVTDRLESLRAAGHLDDRRLERAGPRVSWHLPLLVAIGALVLASVLLPLAA